MDSSVSDYLELLKPRVMSLAIFTAFVGQMMAGKQCHPLLIIISLSAIALGAGAAGCINMWYDRDIDARMHRTKNRPIPSGRVDPDEALGLGITLSILSIVLLSLASNILAGILLASSIIFYIFVYTIWLKRKTHYNIVIGGAAGALPPLIGWASVNGSIGLLPVLMFLIIFFWTPPHFWALSLYRSKDYKEVELPMLPLTCGVEATKRQIVFYSLILYLFSLLPYLLGLLGSIYMLSSLVLGFFFVFFSYGLSKNTDRSSKNLFAYSIIYLFLLFVSILLDKIIPMNF